MLKLSDHIRATVMERDYEFHWNMVQDSKARGWEKPQAHHEGACAVILRYYAMLLDCTVSEARLRMQKRVKGATC
jgi:hypothetical protein